jgi:hypothetical protein
MKICPYCNDAFTPKSRQVFCTPQHRKRYLYETDHDYRETVRRQGFDYYYRNLAKERERSRMYRLSKRRPQLVPKQPVAEQPVAEQPVAEQPVPVYIRRRWAKLKTKVAIEQ